MYLSSQKLNTVKGFFNKCFQTCLFLFCSEAATKVMIELLGTYTEDNASQAREDAHRLVELKFFLL